MNMTNESLEQSATRSNKDKDIESKVEPNINKDEASDRQEEDGEG